MNRSVVLRKSSALFARRLHTWPCHMVLAIEETCSAVRWATQSLCLVNGVLKIELDGHLREYVITRWSAHHQQYGFQALHNNAHYPIELPVKHLFMVTSTTSSKNTKKLLSHREKCMVYLLSFSWYILWVNVPRYIDSYGRMV